MNNRRNKNYQEPTYRKINVKMILRSTVVSVLQIFVVFNFRDIYLFIYFSVNCVVNLQDADESKRIVKVQKIKKGINIVWSGVSMNEWVLGSTSKKL